MGSDPGVCIHVQFSHAHIGTPCLCTCLVLPQSHSHTDLFTSPWKLPGPQEGDQTHQRQNNTKTPYGDINSFTWNSFTATFAHLITRASGACVRACVRIDFLTFGLISEV